MCSVAILPHAVYYQINKIRNRCVICCYTNIYGNITIIVSFVSEGIGVANKLHTVGVWIDV